MALISIPEGWRMEVCALLKNKAKWDPSGYQRCLLDYPHNWPPDLVEAIREHLKKDEPKGCLVSMQDPPGETYEFFFPFLNAKAYGKVLLTRDRRSIVIFSAHLPTGPKLRCE
jgi:hypothetical protein